MTERDLLEVVVIAPSLPDPTELDDLCSNLSAELEAMAESAALKLVGAPAAVIVRRRRDLDPPHPFLRGDRGRVADATLDSVIADYPRRCVVAVRQWGEPHEIRREFEDELGGRVVGWADHPMLPAGDMEQVGCAVLHMDQFGRAILHPNLAVSCNHKHLFHDAVQLVRNFQDLGPTRGWDAIGKFGHVTLIVSASMAPQVQAQAFSPRSPVPGRPADLLAMGDPRPDY